MPIDVDQDYEPTRLILPSKDWPAAHALAVVKADFDAAANYRHNAHDWRWERCDRRYMGVVAQKMWEGTNVKRAAISVMTAYEQVEALLPVLLQAIFGDDPWFEATALGKTPPQAARLCKDIIAAQLYQARVRKVLKLAIKSGLVYGNGLLESCWYYCVTKKKRFRVVYDAKTARIVDPFSGISFNVTTGETARRVVSKIEEDIENRPILKVIPITSFYVDPNCPSTDLNEAQYTVKRSLTPIGELIDYRDEDGYDIPDDETLIEWSKDKQGDQGDLTQMNREASRDANWQPATDQSIDPYAARVELLQYRTKHRIVWVVNRKHVVYNRTNEYNRMMQYSPFYTELIDRFYGMALTDIVDGEQLLQEGILNSRLDELSLAIHPHTKAKSSRQTPAYQLRVRPGGVSYHDNPKEDMIREFPQNVTAQAFEETAASDMRVQKKTGLTDMSLLGVSAERNPGARSATGAAIQGQATKGRIQGQVENLTDEVIEPILHDFHLLNQFHLDPDQRIQSLDGTLLDPLALFGADVRYSCRAASRMQSRIGLLQQLPYILQFTMNPALIQELAVQGKTIDFEEIFQMLIDSTGYRSKATWIRAMTPQEKQAMQQAKPSPDMIKWMMQRERMGQMADMNVDSGEMELMKEIVKNKGDVNKLLVDKVINGNSDRAD